MTGSWIGLLPYAIFGACWLFIPGLVVTSSVRMRGLVAVALAAPVSVGIVGVTAVVAGAIHVPWGPLPVIVMTALTAVAVWAVRRQRKGARPPRPRIPARGRLRMVARRWLLVDARWWAGLVIAAVLMTLNWRRLISNPAALPQGTADVIFHLNGIRWILDHGNASSFALTQMTGQHSFYPAAWHALAALTVRPLGVGAVSGQAMMYAVNATLWVMMALVWPIGVLALARVVTGRNSPLLAVALLAAAIGFVTDFPYIFAGRTQYPNLLSVAVLPACLTLTAHLLRIGKAHAPRRLWWSWGALLVVALAGLALAHPSGLLAYAAMGALAMGLQRCLDARHRKAPTVRREWGLLAAAVVVTAGLWLTLRTNWSIQNVPIYGMREAVSRILTGTMSPDSTPHPVFAVLLLGGIALAVWRRELRWTLVAMGWAFGMWFLAASVKAKWRYWFTSGFYSGQHRIVPYLVIMELVFVAASSSWAIQAVRSRWPALRSARGRMAAVGVAVTLAAVVLGQINPTLAARINLSGAHYRPAKNSTLLDADEFALIKQLPALVTDGKTVAIDPWAGGSMAYALAGVPTTSIYVNDPVSPAVKLIWQRLADASTDPTVCPAVRQLNLGYALDFGPDNRIVPSAGGAPPNMAGIWNIAGKPGFTLLAQKGHAALYRVDACGA